MHRKNVDQLKLHLKELMQERVRLQALLKEALSDEGDKIARATAKLKEDYQVAKEEQNTIKQEKISLMNDLKQSQKDYLILEKAKTKLEDKLAILEDQVTELDNKNDELEKENKHLGKEARTFPQKFAELARQNKKLIEQSADRHYNLGVFYVKNKEYKQAIEEFNKVLEIKPQHAYAHYNLGYIYAEYLVDRKKAIEYFKSYLTYAPDAKDADWVRKYILTWQTWYGKENM